MARMLGKRPPRQDIRTLRLSQYIADFPPPPPSCDLTASLKRLGMMRNDVIGDCTCATVGHMIQAWTAADGAELVVSDEDVVSMYSAITGYSAGDPASDKGAIILDVLNYWRRQGLAGHKLGAYAKLQPLKRSEVMQSIYRFGAAYLGLYLPESAQTQKVWDVPPGGPMGPGRIGSWGGHAVPLVAYNTTGPICITWGALQQMTWGFYDMYGDEAYVCFSPDIVGSDDKSPEGFNAAQLQADLQRITA